MSVIINGNNQTVQGDFTSIVQNYGVGTFNPSYIYASNVISISGNNNTVYGNGVDVTFSATGSNNNTVDNTGISEIQLLTLSMGGNDILASGNNNTLYGSIRDLFITLTGGNNNTAPGIAGPAFGAGIADLEQYNIQLGDNTIGSASAPINGNNDVIYGAMRDYSLTLIGGLNNPSGNFLNGGADTDYFAGEQSNFSVGNNIITVGNGNNDVVYGAMRNLSTTISAPSNSGDVVQTNFAAAYLFTDAIGANTLTIGNGNNDIVFGALQDFTLTLTNANSGMSANINVEGSNGDEFQNYNFGMNTITVGNGNNDVVYGAMQDILINDTGPSGGVTSAGANGPQPFVYVDTWNVGGNLIQVGNGNNDVVYGAMRNYTLDLIGGNDNSGPGSNIAGGAALAESIALSAGGNTLVVGNGNNDVVFGAMQALSFDFSGGNGNSGDAAGLGFMVSSTFSVGGNILAVGNGNNDVAFGALQDVSFTLAAGNDNSGIGVLGGGGTQIRTSNSSAGIGPLLSAGGNVLTVGNGNNDDVYGDMQSFSISLTAGSSNTDGAFAGSSFIRNNSVFLGGDTINVGNGNNDVVFSSMDNLSFSATQGFNNSDGAGLAIFARPVTGVGDNSITFANTTVTIGNGNNDTVVADDALNLTGINLFLDAPTSAGNENTIQWGNNTIIGGTKADNYVFSMVDDASGNMAMQGVDILTNFNPNKGDMLSFGYVTGAANAATLDANSAFVDIHVGGTLSGAIDGVAAIFNQGLGSSVATALETAINSYILAHAPTATGLTLLQDVAAYIANGLASAAGVTAADVQGGVILEGQTSATLGSFTQINAHHALTVEHTAIAVHA